MATTYVRRVNLKATMSDAEVAAYWRFMFDEAIPVFQTIPGVRSIRIFSGAGALRADIRAVIEMDDAGVYERLLADAQVRKIIGKVYAAWDMTTASQTFLREVTPEFVRSLSSA
jgi:hypothetical protein